MPVTRVRSYLLYSAAWRVISKSPPPPSLPAVNDDGGGIAYYYYGTGELTDAELLIDGYVAQDNWGGAMCLELDGTLYSGSITISNSNITNHTEFGRELSAAVPMGTQGRAACD